MGDELLRLVREYRLRQVPDVVAGREDAALAGDDHAAGVQPRQRGGEAVEDRVIERAALARIGDGQPRYPGKGLVDQQASASRGQRARRPPTPTVPPGTGSP